MLSYDAEWSEWIVNGEFFVAGFTVGVQYLLNNNNKHYL